MLLIAYPFGRGSSNSSKTAEKPFTQEVGWVFYAGGRGGYTGIGGRAKYIEKSIDIDVFLTATSPKMETNLPWVEQVIRGLDITKIILEEQNKSNGVEIENIPKIPNPEPEYPMEIYYQREEWVRGADGAYRPKYFNIKDTAYNKREEDSICIRSIGGKAIYSKDKIK